MSSQRNPLTKFLLLSAASFAIGTIHGMLQVMPPIRHWLDSIGSPYGGPGHMIDPLAHAHMNLVGGVVMLAMGATYHLLPQFVNRPIYSQRLVNLTFWWTATGAYSFYVALLAFGFWEGSLLHRAPDQIPTVQRYYGPVIACAATTMAIGFVIYFYNIARTVRSARQ